MWHVSWLPLGSPHLPHSSLPLPPPPPPLQTSCWRSLRSSRGCGSGTTVSTSYRAPPTSTCSCTRSTCWRYPWQHSSLLPPFMLFKLAILLSVFVCHTYAPLPPLPIPLLLPSPPLPPSPILPEPGDLQVAVDRPAPEGRGAPLPHPAPPHSPLHTASLPHQQDHQGDHIHRAI